METFKKIKKLVNITLTYKNKNCFLKWKKSCEVIIDLL